MAKFLGILQEKKQWLAHHWMALLAIVVLGLLPFLSFFASGEALYASDQHGAPSWKFYFEALRHGTIPLWHPYGLGGMPTFDAGFGDGAYPLFLLIGILMPIKTFISYCFILHVVIAGLGAYYLVNRFFGLTRMLSLALATAYMLNTNFISHIHAGHTGKFYIMAWLPLSLYFLLRSLQSTAKVRHSLGLALSVSWLLLTFHPQFMYFILMGYFLAWAFKTWLLLKAKRPALAALTAARFWGPILLGIGMVFFLFYPQTQWTKFYGVRGSGEKTTYEHATSWSMHPEETASLVVPEFTGLNERYWGRNPFKLNSEYPGLSVWFLGILGLVLFRREKDKWFWLWGGVALLAIIFGLGAHTPLFRFFYAFIPGIKNFRAPSMMLFWLATALLLMSADALSRLTQANKPIPDAKRKAWSKRLMQVGFGIAGAFVLFGLWPDGAYGIWDTVFGGEPFQNLANRVNGHSAFALGILRTGVLLGVLVFAARKWLLQETAPVQFGLALLLVTCVDLYWVGSNFIRTYDSTAAFSPNPTIDRLKTDTTQYRVFGIPGAYDRLTMQYNLIETTDGFTDNEYRLYREFRGEDYQRNPNFLAGLKQNPDGTVSGSVFLDMLNVKYLAYRLQNDPGLHVAPNTSALPRAWFVTSWSQERDAAALDLMKQPGFNPRTLAYVSDSSRLDPLPASMAAQVAVAPSALPPSPASPPDSAAAPPRPSPDSAAAPAKAPEPVTAAMATITMKSKDYNRSAWSVNAPVQGILVFSELWFPHWRAQVDGKDVPSLRVDYAFRGVALTPGDHEVTWKYHSPWIAFGFKVGLLSLAGLILLLFGLRFASAKVVGPGQGRSPRATKE
jgi:hypothetical protein